MCVWTRSVTLHIENLFMLYFFSKMPRKNFLFFTSLSCKHTLKLSFTQHDCLWRLSAAVETLGVCSGLMGKNNVCVGGWEARRQSKQRPSATTKLLIKNLRLTLNTHHTSDL